MSKELIESIKALGLKSKDIEAELKMPKNCLASMLKGNRAIPLKWQLALTAFVNVKNGKKQDLPISKLSKDSAQNTVPEKKQEEVKQVKKSNKYDFLNS